MDPKALTAFVSFCILVISWIGDQFYNKKVNESLSEIFAFLVFSLLGLKVLPWKKQGKKTEDEKNSEY